MITREEITHFVHVNHVGMLAITAYLARLNLGIVLAQNFSIDKTINESNILEKYKYEIDEYIALSNKEVITQEELTRIKELKSGFIKLFMETYQFNEASSEIFFKLITTLLT